MSPRPLPESLLNRPDLWAGSRAPAIATEATGLPQLDRELPGGGWPRGALTEIIVEHSGLGELRLLLPALVRLSQAGKRAAFVAPPHLPYAPALARAGVALAQVCVVEPTEVADALWATEQLLRCPAAGLVAAWIPTSEERAQRRLQLAAESTGAVGIVFRALQALKQPSIAALRLRLTPSREGALLEVLKARGGRTGQTIRVAA